MSAGSMTPAATPGARLELTVEALQPGAAMRVRADQLVALLAAGEEELRDAVGPRLRGTRRRRSGPSPLALSAGDRRPQSMTSDVVGQGGGVLPGLAVREREEDDVVAREHLGRRRRELEMGERAQVRLVLDEGLPGVRMRGDGADVEVGMGGEDRRISPPA